MKKNVFGRKFNRDTNERKALFRNLISSLILSEKVKTTEPKAKAIKSDVEKLITKAKKNSDLAKRILAGVLSSQALDKLINDVAPRFKDRQGGYTRIIRVGRRFGDNAMEVVMEFTEKPSAIVAAGPSPRVASPAHKTEARNEKATRSLSEGRQSSSKKNKKRTSRPSVAPRSGKSPLAKKK